MAAPNPPALFTASLARALLAADTAGQVGFDTVSEGAGAVGIGLTCHSAKRVSARHHRMEAHVVDEKVHADR